LPRKAERRRRPRGVVDTSVLVAGISGFRRTPLNPTNKSASLIRDWVDRRTFVWLVSKDIVDEYRDVLRRLRLRRRLVDHGATIDHVYKPPRKRCSACASDEPDRHHGRLSEPCGDVERRRHVPSPEAVQQIFLPGEWSFVGAEPERGVQPAVYDWGRAERTEHDRPRRILPRECDRAGPCS
jgi:hypothetical protein